MAFDTGKTNRTPLIGNRGQVSGRLIKENEDIVNVADWLSEVTTPGSDLAINTSETIPVVAPIKNFRATTALGRKVHFEANFDTGFDTLNDWACVFDDSPSAESRNLSESSANGALSADLSKSSLSIQAAADGAQRSSIIFESKNYIKIPQSGITYSEGQGVFEHPGATDNTTILKVRKMGGSPIAKASWNIDTFDGSGPSEITLDFKKVQTVILVASGKNKGDVKFGFLIDDTLYFAHIFPVNNSVDNTKTLNLPIRTEVIVATGSVERIFGLNNQASGYTFESDMNTTAEPLLSVQQYLNSVVCYTVGADEVEKKIPFVAGNKQNLVNVTAADTPLFSIQCAPTFNGAINRTVYNIDSLSVAASSQNENFGCYISVRYNATLNSSNFIALPNNPESALLYNLDATTATGGIEIFATELMANEKSTFSMKDILKNYRKEFSRNEIAGFLTSTQVLNQTLTVVASPMQGDISTTSLDVSANIFGGEVG